MMHTEDEHSNQDIEMSEITNKVKGSNENGKQCAEDAGPKMRR
jgi:hypothetical protein